VSASRQAVSRYALQLISGMMFHRQEKLVFGIANSEGANMGDKGKKDKAKREAQKKPKLTLKEKRKRKKEKRK
jgi:hypothetical protein